jgi:c-di-GMP-binding flagellar brake protein YcgR
MNTTQEQNRRKHPRFGGRLLAGAQVSVEPCAPLYGEAMRGSLVDLSAGGMAILLSDLIPKKVLLKMKMTLSNGFQLETVITVRHIAQQYHQKSFLHGVEFLNPNPEMVERIQRLSGEIEVQPPTATEIEDFFREAA